MAQNGGKGRTAQQHPAESAKKLAEERAKRSPKEQVALLDQKLGKGEGAKKERARQTASNLTPTIQDIYLYAKSLLGIDPGEPGTEESREFYSKLANLFGAERLLFKRMGERELAQRTDRVYDLLTDYLGWQKFISKARPPAVR